MVKFSIAIPAYKSRFLHECIGSILQQTVPDFELIILNDCSPEPVEAIVHQFTDPRIRYYKNEKNTGAVRLIDNWNHCLSLCQGEYVVIMGDDDRMDPHYLEVFAQLIDAFPGLDVYHCRSKIIDDQGNTLIYTPSCPSYEDVYDNIWHRLRQLRSQFISDFVYRVSTLRQRGGFYDLPLAWGSDDITAYIAAAEKGIAHTNKPVFQYRSNPLSITSTGNDLEKMNANVGYASWLSTFLDQAPPARADTVIYTHLRGAQQQYMLERKRFTMAKSMQVDAWSKCLLWLGHRKRFGLSILDIIQSAIKGRKLKNKFKGS